MFMKTLRMRTLARSMGVALSISAFGCSDPTGGNPICTVCDILEVLEPSADWKLDFRIDPEFQLGPVSAAQLRATTLDRSWRCYYGFDDPPVEQWVPNLLITEAFRIAEGQGGAGPSCDPGAAIPFDQLQFVVEYITAEGPDSVVLNGG